MNQKLTSRGLAEVPMNRFRPNIVVDGLAAFEEDYAESFTVGGVDQAVCLKPIKPCPRHVARGQLVAQRNPGAYCRLAFSQLSFHRI